MPDGIRWVGLDVHARESTLAVFDQASGEVFMRRVVGRPHGKPPRLRSSPHTCLSGHIAHARVCDPSDRQGGHRSCR
jgi:hypothetical protein